MNSGYLQRARFGAFAMYVSRAAALGTGLVFSAALIKYLSVEEFGAYQIVISVVATAALIGSLGIAPVALRYIPEFLGKGQVRNLRTLTALAVIVRLLVLIIFVGATYVSRAWVADFLNFNDFLERWIIIILIYAAVTQIEQVVGPILLGAYFQQGKLGIVQTFSSLVRLAALVVVIQFDFGLGGIILGLLSLEVALTVVYVVLLLGVVYGAPETSRESPVKFPTGRIARFAVPSFGMALLALFRDTLSDNFVIAHFLGLQAVGTYGFAFAFLRLAAGMNPIFFLNSQIEHILVRLSVDGNPVAVLARGHRILGTISLSAVLPVVVLIGLLRNDLASEFGYAKGEATDVMLIAGGFFVFNALQLAYGNMFSVLEAMRYRVYAGVFAIYNLVAAIVLVRIYGLQGVAVASASASLFTLAYYHYVAKRTLGVPICFHARYVLAAVLNTFLAGAILTLTDSFLPSGIGGLLLSGVVFMAAYSLLSLYIRPLHPDDWALLKNAIFSRKDMASGRLTTAA